ncbi:hypothetical protein [Streptoalloteichus hindustanus]|uniref:Lipoprotein n=1 Tax=Streptoalloteichus hindustanus TaxID=2017 RepID=A0A1M5FS09_STRHI|nr:hypothetical protein [Streptoalloteichus hindustanus]SHF94305.1 hypothetical protein SAMN05444320_105567 [Streptoalloteichus hindustanus]
MRTRWMVVAGLVALLGSGCVAHPSVPVESDERIANELRSLRGTGRTRPLKDVVPGDWDAVHILSGPMSRRLVERTVGVPVDMDEVFLEDADLLLLMRGGAVVRVVSTGFHALNNGRYSTSAQLVTAQDPNNVGIGVVDPNSPPSSSAPRSSPRQAPATS